MFPENNIYQSKNVGWIEVITGSMFSGKTEELIRRLKRAVIANQKIKIFKPFIDNRYSADKVTSHDLNALNSVSVNEPGDILKKVREEDVIGIDEVQFFDDEIVSVVEVLAGKGKRVIIAGLDMDYTGKPFHPVPQLLAIAEYVTKIHAICVNCGNLAHYSYRKSGSKDLVELGEKDNYEPLCRACFNKVLKV